MSVELLTFTSGVVFWEQYNSRQVPLDVSFQANTWVGATSIPGLRTSLYCLTGVSRRFEGKSQCRFIAHSHKKGTHEAPLEVVHVSPQVSGGGTTLLIFYTTKGFCYLQAISCPFRGQRNSASDIFIPQTLEKDNFIPRLQQLCRHGMKLSSPVE